MINFQKTLPRQNSHLQPKLGLFSIVVLVALVAITILLFDTLIARSAFAQTETLRDFDQQHLIWGAVLSENVIRRGPETKINYQNIKTHPELLNAYLAGLSKVSQGQFDTFSKDQQLAFLINAYNAFTVKLIVENYPVKSIKDLGSWVQSPWKKRFISLLDKNLSLDEIEHGMIRKLFDEPRIHFAVNCASIGCPALRETPFTADNLSSQLEDSAVDFLNDKSRNYFDSSNNTFHLSAIFKWYGDDFSRHGTIQSFVADRIQSTRTKPNLFLSATVEFLDYDWRLNHLQ
ncbi:MAG: DUF547 domain-containing protein [bacterium]|nr:DUF547 domain-containing protein [bacterium]